MTPPDIERAREQYHRFVASRRTATIATVAADGSPYTLHLPFAAVRGDLYVYVSEVGDHYGYLSSVDRADVMLHADQGLSPNLFAVERARFACAVARVPDEGHEDVFEELSRHKNASTVRLLRSLDFHLFRLAPGNGRYIVGFGKAFDVSFDGERFDHVVIDKAA